LAAPVARELPCSLPDKPVASTTSTTPGLLARIVAAAGVSEEGFETAGDGSEAALARFFASDWGIGEREVRDGKPLYWDLWVPPVGTAAVLALLEFGVAPPQQARWVGRNGFDDGIRDALKAGSPSARNSAALASDALFGALGATLVADRAVHRDKYPFIKSLGNDLTWFFSDGIVTRAAKVSAGRQRPFVQSCNANPNYDTDCDAGRDRNASFFSGHGSSTATLAGLLCSRHRNLLSLDGLWCIGGIGGTAATGVLRIIADDHWATDVITGWSVGAVFGFILPTYVWPALGAAEAPGQPASMASLTFHLRAVSPVVSDDMKGIGYEIRFR
jgi:membrane-associated phospholipid phosphatase